MKLNLKRAFAFLFLCLIITILSCTNEKEFIENGDRSNLKMSRKPFKELLLLKDFNTAYKKVTIEKQKSISSRSALEIQYNFTISENVDVKINEVDNKTFYNILIERDSTTATYFENLLIMIEKIDNVDEASAYIIKYGVPDGVLFFNPSTIDKELIPLFERVSQVCYTACVPICTTLGNYEGVTYDGPHAMSTPVCAFAYIECTKYCVDYNSGGGGGGTGNGESGAGGAGSGETPPPNNGVTTGEQPPELILDPVSEEENLPRRKPCEELNAMVDKPIGNTTPSKTVLTNLNYLKNNVNIQREQTYALSPTSNLENEYVEQYFESILGSDNVQLNFGGNEISIVMHTHWSTSRHLSTFSLDDIYQIYSSMVLGNITLDSNTFTSIVITAHGTQYALKITDKASFISWGANFFQNWEFEMQNSTVQNPLKKFAENKFYKDYNIKLGNSQLQIMSNEIALTKFLSKENIGLELYKANSTFTQWTKLHLNILGSFKETPCTQ